MKNESQIDGKIYLITCTVNGKIYVGQTVQPLKVRWWRHCADARRDSPRKLLIDRAIAKHGKDAFTIEVIDTATTHEELDRLELSHIERLRANDSEVGYNLAKGGGGCSGYKHTEESRRKLMAT